MSSSLQIHGKTFIGQVKISIFGINQCFIAMSLYTLYTFYYWKTVDLPPLLKKNQRNNLGFITPVMYGSD